MEQLELPFEPFNYPGHWRVEIANPGMPVTMVWFNFHNKDIGQVYADRWTEAGGTYSIVLDKNYTTKAYDDDEEEEY